MSFSIPDTTGLGKDSLYATLVAQAEGLLAGERDPWANAANVAALVYALLPGPQLGRLLFPARRRTGGRAVPGPAGLRAHRAGPRRLRQCRGCAAHRGGR
jgi:hypothetical protein